MTTKLNLDRILVDFCRSPESRERFQLLNVKESAASLKMKVNGMEAAVHFKLVSSEIPGGPFRVESQNKTELISRWLASLNSLRDHDPIACLQAAATTWDSLHSLGSRPGARCHLGAGDDSDPEHPDDASETSADSIDSAAERSAQLEEALVEVEGQHHPSQAGQSPQDSQPFVIFTEDEPTCLEMKDGSQATAPPLDGPSSAPPLDDFISRFSGMGVTATATAPSSEPCPCWDVCSHVAADACDDEEEVRWIGFESLDAPPLAYSGGEATSWGQSTRASR
ncbi:hypothetical protein PAPYR_534 [Paratrimastix pyriformis]|uniref:Uncharacterized protein n=1 Tax=Paratrimastix pyriformis TaxID=342808 RepID=A0ABQ8UYA4_9EUKA|nr:hypothetical protein PAPYR_534 [Paratrimastix pyriformis]